MILVTLVTISWLLPLATTGLWDPHELDTADLVRRAAIHVFGADELATGIGNDTIPSVEDVGRGELPILTMALSLKLFGSSAWALRLPMLLWGLIGLAATYVACARLAGTRVGLVAVLVMATCPLYFLQARTALGDVATMASLAIAFSGLLLSLYDSDVRWRWVAAALGISGMFAGFHCRGALVGVALPSLSVGLASLFVGSRTQGVERRDVVATVLAAVYLSVGLGAAVWGAWAAWVATPDDYFKALGGTVINPKQFSTHDFVVHHLGHALFPWSAVLPLALGLVLRSNDELTKPEMALRAALFLISALGVGCYTLLAPRLGLVPFGPVFALAAIVALALRELDRRPQGIVPLAMVTAALLVLFYTDYKNFPDKGFSAFGVADATFPESFQQDAKRYSQVVVGLGALACVLLVLEQAVSLSGLRVWLDTCAHRLQRVKPVASLSRRLGQVIQRLELAAAGTWRGSLLGLAILLSGLVMSVGYYPALAAQLSPVGALDAFERLSKPGEPLGLMGERGGALLLTGEPAEVFSSTHKAIKWLNEGEGRRWLVAKADDLSSLNSRHRRQKQEPPRNLPVLDDGSSRALLISNQLRDGEKDLNPLAKWLPDERPKLVHPLDVELDGRLRVLGWEIRDQDGQPVVNSLRMGRDYEFVVAYEVLRRVSGNWQAFIHMDGEGQRFNGDHDMLQDEYAYRHWNKGDYVLDVYPFELESRYPPGEYQVYFGLFSGDKRMPVTQGKHSEDRIQAGTIEFRH